MSDIEEDSQKLTVKELFRNVRDHIDGNLFYFKESTLRNDTLFFLK
jgi:hypothetical protein